MSQSESGKERSEGVPGLGDHGGDDDGCSCRDDSKQREHGRAKNPRKAKRLALFRFRRAEKQLHRRNKMGPNPPPHSTPGCFCKRVGGGGRGGAGGGGGSCFKQTPTTDSPGESQTSDPNSPNFTYELLRALIEKNDFYSNECNPHLDKDGTNEV